MKTFTTYAEKKAKQFFNLLQGYTKGIRMTAILILLLMGVNNVWGNVVSSPRIYYDNTNTSYEKVAFMVGHNSYSRAYKLTKIENTNLWYRYLSGTGNDYWGDATQIAIFGVDWDNAENNNISHRANYTNNNYTTTRTLSNTSGSCNSLDYGNTYLVRSDGNKSTTYIEYQSSGYNALNSQQEIKTVVDGTVANSKATIDITSYEMTDNGKATKKTASVGTGASSSYISAARTATTTLTVGTVATGYQFDGWYTAATGGTQLSSSTTYTYYPTAATTVYARFSEKKYTVTVKNDGHGTTTPSGAQSNVGQVTGLSIKATPAANYEFVNWTITSGSGSFGSETSASTTFKPTSAATIQANFRSTATNFLNVEAGEGIASVTGSTDPVTLGNPYNITATPKTGYTFSTWTANPAENATFGSATTANTTVTVNNGSVTVTASATENMSTLTTSNSYTEGNPGYAAPTASVNSIGYETTATVTATAAGNGYTFTGWTLTNCTRTDGGAADATSITVRSNGDGGAATVIANYEKIPSKTVYFRPKTDWKSNNPVIICDEVSTAVTPYDCAGEYYTAEVPGGTTDLKFGGNNEKTLSLTVPTDNKVLYDMTSQTITALYLKPGDWDKDGAWFAVYLCNGTDAATWHEMKKIEGTELYGVEIESSKLNSTKNKNVIFVRMDKNKSTLDWSSKWNQSKDLDMPTNGTNQCTISDHWSSSNASGSWHKVWDNSCWKEFSVPTYDITLTQKLGGTITVSKSSDITLNEQVTVTMTADPGYSFQSGTIKIGNQEEQTISTTESTHTICGPTTITATWKPDTHTVTFDANGHGTAPDEQSVDHNEKVEEPADPTANGYTFGGWYTDANCNTAWNFDTDVVTADMTLYAKWTATEYTITYNDLYGVTHSNPKTYTIESETITFIAPTSTRTGYTFAGWDPTEIKKGSTGNQTVTAQWTINNYNITYTAPTHGNFTIKVGSNDPVSANTTADYNTTITLANTPATGYHFSQWNIEPNVSITNNTFSMPANDVTIGVTFAANTYKVKFNKNADDATGSMSDQSFTYDEASKALTANAFTRTGYTFEGWNTKDDGTGAPYTDGQEVQNLTADHNGTINLYAQWTERLSTITITTNPAEGGNITVDDEPFTPGNTVQVGIKTSKKVTAKPNPGYGVATWTVSSNDIVKASGSETVTLKADGSGREGTLCANFVGLEYTITFNKQNGIGGTEKASVNYKDNNYSVDPVEVPNRTGYTFGGYYTQADGLGVQVVSAEGDWVTNATDYTDADGKWLVHENTTLYAQWTAKTYTVTLDQTEAKVEGTTSVTATYDAAMPSATMPTAANGYVFMGYFDGEQGAGTQYYNADGTSAHVWDKAEDATLYAHFVKVEITQITLDKYTFEPVEAGGTGFVTATPTIEPTPTNAVVLCWRLLYNNGNEVPGRSAQEVSGNIVKFSIAGLAAGTYKIEAVLRTGSNCGSGDVLSTKTVNFTIASNYTITVKYTCDGKEIMAASKVPARVSEETEITAPNITGYTFSSWEAGDGVTIKSTNGNSVKITAIYDGYLTAKYTARPMVYFKNTLGWEKVYVYTFSDNAWWNDGTGVHPATNKLEQGEMTQIGESDVYYFELDKPDSDYTQDNNANPNYIAFSNKDMRTENGAFWECDAIYRGDHKAELTLFVPQKDQTPETHNKTKYYSKGIWMKYNSTESGYQLPGTIPNDDPDHDGWGTYGNKFTAQTPGGYTFSITKYLEANTEYTFKIKNYVWVKDYNNTDNNQWFGYDGTINNSTTNWLHFKGDNDEGKNNGDAKIKTTAEGEYTFTIDLSQGKVLLSVEYPIEVGDYRVIYKDNAIWSQGTAHDANWYHPSRIIKKNKTAEPTKDIISFFISYGQNTEMQFQRVKSITNGNVTWENAGEARIPDAVNKAGVYNFIVTQTANGASISMENSAEPYTGNYYIRVDALAGKWDNYKTNPENRMTYSAFSESEANSFGDKYSHYATKYCDEGTNIKFVIANDYSPCISDTLAQDVKVNGANPFDNLDEHGTIKSNYQQNKANVRFMWNHKTNKISRVYIGSASETERHFLVLKSDKEMKGEDGKNLQNEGDDHAKHKAVFKDTQNWMYERTIKVQPGTRVKLYACYPMDNDDIDAAEQKAQHFRGAYDGNTWNDNNSVVILGGEGDNWNKIRIIYDFKTNRLMAALVPDQEVSGEKTIAADVMIIRKHQDAATSITLTNDNSKLKEVKTVYGSLQLNRWVLNNRNSEKSGIEYCTKKVNNQDTYDENVTNEHHPVLSPGEQKSIYERALYFISFPFDVHLSDVFGFGTYGTHWVISDYNGLRRAQRGYFAEDCINEDCTNWDYIWDPSNFTLKANQGYLLSLDLDLMRYDNTDFWLHNIDQVELFFPSTANLETIEKTSYTMPALSEEYLCKINHNTDGTTPDRDRRVKDSYWRCIGVPSFADYDGSLYKSKEDAESDKDPINWNTDYTWTADESGFPFLYEWNVTDNSLSVQNTSAYQFKPTFAYLVQNGDAIYWKAVNAKPSSPIIARQRTETERNYEWKIALLNNGNQEDQTFLRITDNENVTTAFDFNQDLAKEFNYGRSDIYTLIGYERAAANSMPCSDETTIIPLGLNIEQAGDYTIAMPEGVENIGITLVDNETGIHTNLSAGQEYTLTLNNGICENRLFIEVSPIQNTPTDLEYTTGDTREQTTRKMLIDGMLYLIRDGIIYDAQGHKL